MKAVIVSSIAGFVVGAVVAGTLVDMSTKDRIASLHENLNKIVVEHTALVAKSEGNIYDQRLLMNCIPDAVQRALAFNAYREGRNLDADEKAILMPLLATAGNSLTGTERRVHLMNELWELDVACIDNARPTELD